MANTSELLTITNQLLTVKLVSELATLLLTHTPRGFMGSMCVCMYVIFGFRFLFENENSKQSYAQIYIHTYEHTPTYRTPNEM